MAPGTTEGVQHPTESRGVLSGAAAVPGMKRQDGSYVSAVVPPEWEEEQVRLAKEVVQINNLSFSSVQPFEGLKYIAGVDISFVKGTNKACAMLAILNYPSLTLARQIYDIVEMTEEYIPFYLAFREVRHLIRLFEEVKREAPNMYPQVTFVDGGGVWHPKGLGLASHLGVLLNMPTVGLAKSLLYLPDIPTSITYDSIRVAMTPDSGFHPIHGDSGNLYGAAVIPRNAVNVEKPIFVSVGHRLDLATAVELVHATAKYRIPEPIRAADGGSREALRLLEERERTKKINQDNS